MDIKNLIGAKKLMNNLISFSEMSAQVNTEERFDQEFSVEEIANAMVSRAKAQVKSRLGNKKRHRQ